MPNIIALKSRHLTFSKPHSLRRAIRLNLILIGTLLSFTRISHANVSGVRPSAHDRKPAGELSNSQRKVRLHHAHELLGRYYKKSSVSVGESIPKINSAVYHWTKDHLPAKYKSQSGQIAQTIIDVSMKQQFDPVFLMSVIEGESSWRPEKVGGVGEIGLMQLRPSTGQWMAKRAGVKWQGDKTLFDPCLNIKIGAAYLNYLRDRFDDHARLYLAAYNMGQTNVDSALIRKIWPKDYPIHIMKYYVEFYEAVGPKLAAQIPKSKSIDKMRIVVKYTPSTKKAKASDFKQDDDDTDFDIDKLTHPSGDPNSQDDARANASNDRENSVENSGQNSSDKAIRDAAGAALKPRALPNRS
jgi:hypothetical protein